MKKAHLKIKSIILKGKDDGGQYELSVDVNSTPSTINVDLEHNENNLIHKTLFSDTVNDFPYQFNISISAENQTTLAVSQTATPTIDVSSGKVEYKTNLIFGTGDLNNYPKIEVIWEASSFSSVFADLEVIHDCLCKINTVYDSLTAPLQSETDNLKSVEIQNLFSSLGAICTSLGISIESYDSQLSGCQNLAKLITALELCERYWNEGAVISTDYDDLESDFQSLKTAFETLKSNLTGAGLNPCITIDRSYDYEILCGLYEQDLNCICKFMAQLGSLPPNVDAVAQDLAAAGESYLGEIYSFFNSYNITEFPEFDFNASNPYCYYFTQTVGLLKWICENYPQYNFSHDDIFSLQSGWSEILDLLDKLRDLDPGMCGGVQTETVLQSNLIYLQSVGSDNTDDTQEGIHLRWAFRNELADYHLPKGDLANKGNSYFANFGYTKEDDYVQIYKTPYINTVPVLLNLSIDKPYDVVSTTDMRKWNFVIKNTHGSKTINNEVEIRFFDPVTYDTILIDPKLNPSGFLTAYSGFIEIEVKNKLMFAADIEVDATGVPDPILKYETIWSETPTSLEKDFRITSREEVTNSATVNQRIVGENMRYLRLQAIDGEFGVFSLETYYDFWKTRDTWVHVDDFGLTLDDNEAYDRLDNPAWVASIDNEWPRYNHGTRLKKTNYQSKWLDTDGLKDAVTQYLTLSKTDMKAEADLVSEDPKDSAQQTPVLPISYLDMLNLVSVDFHVARMLGLGHIDDFNLNGNKYIYRAVYITHKDLPVNRGITLQSHEYMSLPTDKTDYRLPKKPTVSSLEYGLTTMDEVISDQMFKPGGYARFGEERFVNVSREKYSYEIDFEDFFEQSTNFSIREGTRPVLFGVEYRDFGSNDYVKPEITAEETGYEDHDDTMTNVFETVPVVDSDKSLYTHVETNEGVHEYALYAINWFSRVSDVSDPEETDNTSFDFNPIKAPLDAHAHYIQEEDPLIFTSANEQTELNNRISANPSGDNFWTRVTFNWNHIHNIAYKEASKIEFFYRESLPLSTRGQIESVTEINGEDAVLVATKSFSVFSTDQTTTVTPSVSSGEESKFVGSWLNVEGNLFEILEVTQGGSGPVFKVKIKPEHGSTTDPDTGLDMPVLIWKKPVQDEYIMATENLSNPSNWSKLAKTIDLVSFSNRTEDITDPDGQVTTYNIGGVEGDAVVIDDPGLTPVEGLYKITFDTEVLSDHSQEVSEHVFWQGGLVRVLTNDNRRKALKVLRIENTNPITLWAIDGSVPSSPTDDDAVKTHATNLVDVNFHPGYKVYLEPETAINLDKDHLIPTDGSEKNTGLIALRAIDDTVNPDVVSELTSPLTIFGLYVKEPQKPATPAGPSYSTRPDTSGKCSYTFDVETTNEPFSIAVYRAHDTALLEALYEDATVEGIYQDLGNLSPNDYNVNRFNDLANGVLDTDPSHEGEWKEYDGYRFPEPDLSGLLTGSETFAEKTLKIQQAIYNAFIPITTQPIVYSFTDSGTTTSSSQPVIRDTNGHLLNSTDLEFDPFPMARNFVSSTDSKPYLRYTDYSLEGASTNLYFYFAVEITRELKVSEPSIILGPVRIINSFPAETPYIGKVETILQNPAFEEAAGVRFNVNPYLAGENVKAVRIYRSTNEAMSSSVRLMDEAVTVDINGPIEDHFDGLIYPPFGEDIYYRVVALREIVNEQDELEYVPSKPSQVVKARVVDNVNPDPPVISYVIGSTSTSPAKLIDVTLSWSETCYKGKYHLYKMTDAGQWQLVDSFDYTDTLSYFYSELDKEDADGDTIYHRFKIEVENTGGLLNLEDDILIL